MAHDDRIAILADEEDEEQKRRDALSERFNRLSLEVQDDPSAVPASQPSDPDPTPAMPTPRDLTCCERLYARVNQHLLVSKVFYFFFYAAYGSLHPLLPVFYKQLGITATLSGILVGIRYFIEFCSAPFWGAVADRYRKGKVVLLFSVFCWLMFNCGIGFVKPAAVSCGPEEPSTSTTLIPTVAPSSGTSAPPVPPSNGTFAPPVSPSNGTFAPPVPHSNGTFAPPVPPSNGTLAPPVSPSNGTVAPPVPPSQSTLAPTVTTSKGTLVVTVVSINSTVTSRNGDEAVLPLTTSPNHSRQRRDLIGHPASSNLLSTNEELSYGSQHQFKRSTNVSMNSVSLADAEQKLNPTRTDHNTTTTSPTPPEPTSKNYVTDYDTDQVENIFLIILLVIIIGEFFSAPAVTIVDTVRVY